MIRRNVREGVILAVALLFSAISLHGQDSPHGTLRVACEECHTVDSWKVVPGQGTFDHAKTEFELTGRHIAVTCAQCHHTLVFSAAPTRCADCHTDVHRGELGKTCDRCHTTSAWLVPDMTQRHSGTRFPLIGPHTTAACQACHTNQQKHEYVGVPTTCFGCHRVQYEATLVPAHRAAGFGTQCEECHTMTAMQWGGSFDHNRTAFPLAGAHAAVPCIQCHAGGRFQGTPTQCVVCHQALFASATNPRHTGFSTNCVTCHTMIAWRPSSFDHRNTGFPLTGAHAQVSCTECHVNGSFAGTSAECSSCHMAQFNAAVNPKHTGFPTACVTCHSTASWHPALFDHNTTAFPLTGAHVQVPCASCHPGGTYTGTKSDCASCHIAQFNNAVNPKHTGFSTACVTCHTTSAWHPAAFDHSKTAFPLTGAHVSVTCASCHANGVYAGTPTDCASCHMTQFNSAVNPKHTGFPTACVTCHTTAAWRPASFDHNKTAFPLTGAHVAVACASCHANGVYAGTATDCASCHIAQFNSALNPKHAGLPTTCVTCHTTTAWQPSTFDHSKTPFPLTGAHIAVVCASCHANGVYAGTATDCASCHITQFNNALNPKHTGFPTTCVTCHTTTAWQPSTFNHSTTAFPLTGAHIAVPCASCHVGGVYAGTKTDCASCHISQFNAATNPSHTGFPTQCQTCHTTTAWQPSTFAHDTYFPISAGSSHPPGRWTACSDCHAVPTNYASFTCLTCHEHAQSLMDPKHSGVSGYRYDSQACYSCHPRGRGG